MALRDIQNKYHYHDARNIGDLLPDRECIDVTITSPPYWDLKDYGYKTQIGYGQGYEQYLSDIQGVFRAIYDRTKSTGSLWIVSDTFKQKGVLRLLPFDMSDMLAKSGWMLQDIIIWEKDRTLPWSHQGKLRNIFEYITFYTKSSNFKYHLADVRDIADIKDYWVRYPERYSPEGKTPARMWNFPIPRQGSWGNTNNYVRHACPLPPGLIERITKLTSNPGDLILDPFAGSGSVLATAHALKRRYIGTDLNKHYKKMFLSSVLPSILELYQSKRNDANNKELPKKRFRQLVESLRHLKFPKELVRLYRKKWNFKGCVAILVFPLDKLGRLKIEFIFHANAKTPKLLTKRMDSLAIQAPLSKYGISPKFSTCNAAEVNGRKFTPRGWNSSKIIYVYRNGRFYSWESDIQVKEMCAKIRLDGFSEYCEDKYPPIISGIDIDIDPNHPDNALGLLNASDQETSKETR